MRYLVKVNELKERIDFINNQIKVIEENIDSLNKIKTTIVWEGVAAVKFMNNYNKYLVELGKLKSKLDLISKYLIGYHDRYGTAYRDLINKFRSENEEV